MKLIGSIILAICPIVVGFKQSNIFKKNITYIEKIIELINWFIGEIKYKRTEIKDMVETLCNKENFKNLEFLQNLKIEIKKKPFPIAWVNSVEKWECSISKDDKDLLKSFSNIIGAYDYEGQVTSLKYIRSDFITF